MGFLFFRLDPAAARVPASSSASASAGLRTYHSSTSHITSHSPLITSHSSLLTYHISLITSHSPLITSHSSFTTHHYTTSHYIPLPTYHISLIITSHLPLSPLMSSITHRSITSHSSFTTHHYTTSHYISLPTYHISLITSHLPLMSSITHRSTSHPPLITSHSSLLTYHCHHSCQASLTAPLLTISRGRRSTQSLLEELRRAWSPLGPRLPFAWQPEGRQGVHRTPWECTLFHACHAKAAEPRTPEGRQGVHQTPWQCTLSHACHAKAAEPKGHRRDARAYIRSKHCSSLGLKPFSANFQLQNAKDAQLACCQ